jgi:hypothetical protein
MDKRLFDTINRFERIDLLQKNRDLERYYDRQYKKVEQILYKNNYSSLYNYRGNRGNFKYSTDTSVKSDPIRLDKYGNEYEEGRRTILAETANSYGVNVGGYIFKNADVKKVSNNKTPKLNIVGINL